MACISIEDELFVGRSTLLRTSDDEENEQDDFNANSGAWSTPEADSDQCSRSLGLE